MDRLLRHVAACNNARLPGGRCPLLIAGSIVGWVAPALTEVLAARPEFDGAGGRLTLRRPAALPGIGRELAAAGHFHWRDEAFDVRATPFGPVLAEIDRGALPLLGIMSVGVHVNGLVRRRDGIALWVAHRSHDKRLDPGKLDHIVAGGVPAGLTPAETMVKEAAEEAAIPAELAARAAPVGQIAYAMERPEGLRRDLLVCYDLELPEHFTPRPADGEVERFSLWPIARSLAAVRDGDAHKFNVSLVLLDLFLRLHLIAGHEAAVLRAALLAPAWGAPGASP